MGIKYLSHSAGVWIDFAEPQCVSTVYQVSAELSRLTWRTSNAHGSIAVRSSLGVDAEAGCGEGVQAGADLVCKVKSQRS